MKTLSGDLLQFGLAGGDWGVILTIIEEELAGEDDAYVAYSA